MQLLKLIWDFRSPTAHDTAKHYEIHLKEFMAIDKIPYLKAGVEVIVPEEHAIAFIIVDQEHMKPVRDALKPHRGLYYKEEE
ncbi:hypothetical protein JM658_08895 [Joostella atrarenae]|uniref:YCII-related domain-containing protein n=1 Tax=Joostella atrarenae TaxID=679257 RepID=A0ABS9J3D4_9FLAO|nr:hypothetical protein [Joostella atrarenae]MCF8714942.1 hypothetical protein [Joostella atrarenae]